MKRLILLAAMVGLLATSCEKTEIRNEVNNVIDFTSKVGKQTKAIVNDNTYLITQPFGVFAYGHQTKDNSTTTTQIMNNVEIGSTTSGTGNDAVTTWKSTSGSYYWPNDPTTTIDFYAYSPYIANSVSASANHQKMNGTLTHSENEGLKLENYKHSNMYVDFMVANPVTNATYADPDGKGSGTNLTKGTVPVKFNHMLTQLLFNVSLDNIYKGITFTVQSITLNNINNIGTFTFAIPTNGTLYAANWSTSKGSETTDGTYKVFPAIAYAASTAEDGSPALQTSETADSNGKLNNENNATTNTVNFTTTPITVLPQTLKENSQSLTVVYKIEGTGVATETVTKTIYFAGKKNAPTEVKSAVLAWNPNKKITYKLTIGLKEILFAPVIENNWSDETSEDIEINQLQ